MTTVRAVDLFCGAGGATTGVYQAARQVGVALQMTAINHWPVAVETHSRNHPTATHLCMSVESVDPRTVVPAGHLHLLVAGPECTHHSNARGGRPIHDQSRASAWNILRWCELLKVDQVLIENVPEFQTWGPLGVTQRPLKRRKGETYRAFLAALHSLGYRVEAKVLNAADYGDATTRKRLFIQAKRGRAPIVWPEPSHSRHGHSTLLRHTERWRGAREVIDWQVPSRSIFDRDRPLSPNTMRRIEVGLRRFAGRPFVLQQQSGGVARSTEEPLPSIATDGAISMVEPFVVQITHGGREHSIHKPLPTITGGSRGDFALVEPQPFLVPMYRERRGQTPRTHSIDEPVPTIPATGGGKFGLVEPFTLPYYSNGGELARPVSEPVATVTSKARFALVIPDGMDIRFRMLQPHELAAAMGFPEAYSFAGSKTDVIKQIGNAWACHTATALCRTMLEGYAERRRSAREEVA
jgi:DNA (cytosine-5)-methyltransferase 1